MKKFTSVKDVANLEILLQEALQIKKSPFAHKDIGKNKTLGLLFFNPSLRTRLSTEKAALNLGMNVMVMNMNSDGWALELEDGTLMNKGTVEHIKDAAAIIGQYCDIIGIRTFASLNNQTEDYQEKILNKFVAHAGVPIISLESATLHPLQSFADLMTIEEHKPKHRPKVVLTWAPHVKALPQAVANSYVEWMKEAEVDLTITHPKGYDLSTEFTQNVAIHYDQSQAFEGADFIYAKNWSSFNNYGKITADFNDWTVTQKKMELTNQAKFMHCLPVRRNLVATDDVLDHPNSLVLAQANNRTYAAQTILLKMLKKIANGQ